MSGAQCSFQVHRDPAALQYAEQNILPLAGGLIVKNVSNNLPEFALVISPLFAVESAAGNGVESAYNWLTNSTRAVSTITSATIGGVNGYTGAVVTGGTQRDAMSAAFSGAMGGAILGYSPPKTIISNILFNGVVGAASDYFGQYISHSNGLGTWNKGETLGAAGGGLLFAGIVHPSVPWVAAEPFAFGIPTVGAAIGSAIANKQNTHN